MFRTAEMTSTVIQGHRKQSGSIDSRQMISTIVTVW